MPELTDQYIEDIYNEYTAGRQQDAINRGINVGNPWVINTALAYKRSFGRLPTANEVMAVMPAFSALGSNGDAYVAQLAEQEANSPEALDKKKRSELEGKAPGFYGSVDSSFQSVLGRAASDQEKAHFGKLLASGDVDEYTLGEWLKSMPESVRKQDEEFRNQLRGEISSSDQRYLSESVLPAIQSKYALAGRSFDGSAFAGQLANAAQAQNIDREKYLANLSADMYSGRSGNAREDYINSRDRAQGLSDYYRQSRDANVLASRDRLNTLADYDIQRKTYEEYLRRYGKQKSWVNDLSTGLDIANSVKNLVSGGGGGGMPTLAGGASSAASMSSALPIGLI